MNRIHVRIVPSTRERGAVNHDAYALCHPRFWLIFHKVGPIGHKYMCAQQPHDRDNFRHGPMPHFQDNSTA